MIWVNVIAVLIMVFSLVGGLKEGVVKKSFSLVVLLIAIALAGLSYHFLASLLSFLPGENWENFIGFLVTLAAISIIFVTAMLPQVFQGAAVGI